MFSKIKVKIVPKFLKNFGLKRKFFPGYSTEDLCYNNEVLKKFRVSKFINNLKFYYVNGKYEKILSKYNQLKLLEKHDPYIYRVKILADEALSKQNAFLMNFLRPKFFTPGFIFFSLVVALAGGYYWWLSSAKELKEEDGNNNFFKKLFNPEGSFNINFANNVEERLDNVKGIDEVREEIEQLIKMIKDPKRYVDAGAKLHKGILLCGKPGTGKTLIARAIAGESGVNFLSLTGSDFDEIFVGVGAARIRKLFQFARKNQPCIIFIDEIDSLLTKSRRQALEHSSSRATINQFLAEMDGFEKLEQVFLIGATNHEKDLDSAAIRPGRFDKRIHINVPDEEGRQKIIDFYLNKIKLDQNNLNPIFISKMTPGFTGAEIENLVNLAIISAVNNKSSEVTLDDIGEARDRILMGISRKKFNASDRRRYLTSLHEGGHALVCFKNPICKKKLHKLTIIPRGPAEGVTFTLHDEEALDSKEEFISEIDMAMGGHVAEELMYGKEMMTAGCSSDLNKATRVAQMMVKKLGMYGEKAGYLYVEDTNNNEFEKVSEKYKQSIDETVSVILKESHDRVYDLLNKNANDLKNIAQAVFQYDTLNGIFISFYLFNIS
jgi:ATP-dependent metalloprotease